MEENRLAKIVEVKRASLAHLKERRPLSEVMNSLASMPPLIKTRSFYNALDRSDRLNLIGEIKRASPSKGLLREEFDPVEIGMDYEANAAAAISVLTEEHHFQGSLEHLRKVRACVSRPILRKDFLFDPYQIYEAAEAGSDAVLLIVAILEPKTLSSLLEIAHKQELDALVEVHNPEELRIALDCGATIVGVNNRDLKTFKVDLQTSMHLAPHVPDSIILVSESGINTSDDIRILRDAGYDAFLIGELFMKAEHPGKALRELMIRSLN